MKAFAGSAPVTKASGRSIRITHRHVKNNRLAAVGFVRAFVAAGCQGPTREHTTWHAATTATATPRHLYNRVLGQLPQGPPLDEAAQVAALPADDLGAVVS